MAFNNGFPVGYQPYYQQAYQVPVAPSQPNNQQSQSSGIIWVQGEAGAKSYLVAPNTTVQLWDSENQVIYLKSADTTGMPSMKILDYQIRQGNQNVSQPQIDPTSNYVTKDELTTLKGEISELRSQVESINRKRNGGNNHGKPAVQLNAE